MWHARVFESPAEAAAFIAALSRWLDSPAASASGIAVGRVDLRAQRDGSLETVNVFFNDAARAAALRAFPPGLKIAQWMFDLPEDSAVLLDGRVFRAMGSEEVEAKLAEL